MRITATEIRALNRARDVLEAIAERAQDAVHEQDKNEWNVESTIANLGRLTQVAGDAENAVFRVLNIARSYVHLDIDEDLLHNREKVKA